MRTLVAKRGRMTFATLIVGLCVFLNESVNANDQDVVKDILTKVSDSDQASLPEPS